MTDLLALLRRRIRVTGPLTLAEYMAEALGHPTHGYYTTRDPLGRAGDFTTAPEISQMFGELLGLWCADAWLRLGRPDPVLWIELGPGRGTLMKDAWRATGQVPGFHRAVRLFLLETSPTLCEVQGQALAHCEPVWIERMADLPDGPVLAIANEFFDALPIRQFQQTDRGWRERLVDWDEASGKLRYVLAPKPDPASTLIPASISAAPVNSIAEVSPAAVSVTAELSHRITRFGGAALVVDYGSTRSAAGDSFQAVRNHEFADPLVAPGEADLTSHVDFQRLAEVATESGAVVEGPYEQGGFLAALGINQRAEMLKAGANDNQRDAIDAALHRLTSRNADAMGELFKVLTVLSANLASNNGET
ncbi:MAG: SAM-dependent methyltransferase [Pseudomonadota bacterium]